VVGLKKGGRETEKKFPEEESGGGGVNSLERKVIRRSFARVEG